MGKRSPKSDMVKTSMSKSPVLKSPMVKTSMSKSSIPRSPMPKSPVPKSPMPNSPMPKSPVIYEKYKSRCAYGLISFFNFRRRHSKRLISDAERRRLSKHALGDGYIKDRLDFHSDQHIEDEADDKIAMVDSRDVRENKIKGADASIKQKTKEITRAKVENIQSNSEFVHDLSRKQRKAAKTVRRTRLPVYGCYDVSTVGNTDPSHQNLAERSSKSLDSTGTVEVLPNQVYPKNGRLNEINLLVNMNEATEAFVNQKLLDGKHLCDGVSHQSRHFLDALEVLNSNRELFINLLQDPNSLLVKHIEDLRDNQAKEQQNKPFTKAVSEHEIGNMRECNLSKSKETGGHHPLENIVVLRPNRISHDSPQVHYSLRNVQQSGKPALFPFEQIKRKLMQSMGICRKEKQLLLTDGAVDHMSTNDTEGSEECRRRTGMEISTRSPIGNASSDFEGVTASSMSIKRKDQMENVNEFDPAIIEKAASASESDHENSCLSTLRHPERNKHDENINISNLKNGNATPLRKRRAKTWDGISSVSECDVFPMVSSRGTREHSFASPQMRFSAYSSHQMVSDSNLRNQKEKKMGCSSPLRQNFEARPWALNKKQLQMYEKISDTLSPDVQEHKNIYSLNNDSCQTEIKYVEDSKEEVSPSEVPSKPDVTDNDDVNRRREAVDKCEENGSLDFPGVVSPVESQTSTSSKDDYLSSPLSSWNVGEFDRFKDNAEQPSPVSVLDFTEDVNSPLNVESQPALPLVRRLQIGIEEGCLAGLDLKINSSISSEDYGSMFVHVSTVLQACRLNWDELAQKCHFNDQLLDRSLLDEIDAWPKSCGDRNLLFDYVNEVLLDVCQQHLRCSPWLSFIRPRILSNKVTGSLVHEVMQNVDWNLLSGPTLETLEKIIENDLHRSGKWMDIRIDAEEVIAEMLDSLVEELTIEMHFI